MSQQLIGDLMKEFADEIQVARCISILAAYMEKRDGRNKTESGDRGAVSYTHLTLPTNREV